MIEKNKFVCPELLNFQNFSNMVINMYDKKIINPRVQIWWLTPMLMASVFQAL